MVNKKKEDKSFVKWVNRNLSLIIISIITVILIIPPLAESKKSIFYENKYFIPDSADKFGEIKSKFIKIRFETDNAFLPYENIEVKVSLWVADNNVKKRLSDTKLELIFPEAIFTSSNINKQNIDEHNDIVSDDDPIGIVNFKSFKPEVGKVLLKEDKDNPGIFIGKCEMHYTKQGDFNSFLVSNGIQQGEAYIGLVKIGSSVDVLTKRTNDLLLSLAVITLLFLFNDLLKKKINPPSVSTR